MGALQDFGEMTWLLSPEGRLVGQNLSLSNLSKIRCLLGRILEYYKGLVRESGKFYSDTTRILLFSVNSPPPPFPINGDRFLKTPYFSISPMETYLNYVSGGNLDRKNSDFLFHICSRFVYYFLSGVYVPTIPLHCP